MEATSLYSVAAVLVGGCLGAMLIGSVIFLAAAVLAGRRDD